MRTERKKCILDDCESKLEKLGRDKREDGDAH